MNHLVDETFDLVIAGGGTAGLMAYIAAAERGMRVALVESQPQLGGTLHWAAGLMSAAGTSLQRLRGIEDSPEAHHADVMRISKNTADPVFVQRAVELAPDTIEWLLDHGFDVDPACPQNVANHAFYSVHRTYWGRNRAISILEVLLGRIQALPAASQAISLNTRVEALATDSHGRVVGVAVRGPDGRPAHLRARNVVVTTGGFAGNPKLFRDITGKPLYGPQPDGSDGSGLELVAAAGGVVRKSPYLMSSVGGVEDAPGTGKVSFFERPQLIPQHRLPWEIYVDRKGMRFMREDNPHIDEREQDLARLPDTTFWIVMDSATLERAPALFPMWTQEQYLQFLQRHHGVSSAGTLEELAHEAGIDAAGLAATVDEYNEAVAGRHPDRMGRLHCPLPLSKPPFYAIRNHAVIIKTHWGIHVNAHLQATDERNHPIAGLHACGEVLGGSLLSGNSYVTGMSITPALSFGRWLGQTLD